MIPPSIEDSPNWEESYCIGCRRADCFGECDAYRVYMDEHFSGPVAMERKEAMGLPWDALLPESDEEKERQSRVRAELERVRWPEDMRRASPVGQGQEGTPNRDVFAACGYTDDFLLSMTGQSYADFCKISQAHLQTCGVWVSPEEFIDGFLWGKGVRADKPRRPWQDKVAHDVVAESVWLHGNVNYRSEDKGPLPPPSGGFEYDPSPQPEPAALPEPAPFVIEPTKVPTPYEGLDLSPREFHEWQAQERLRRNGHLLSQSDSPNAFGVDDIAEWCQEEAEAGRLEALDLPEKPDRISWEDYFLGLADVVSRRSIDGETKHGCLLVDQHNHIIGLGYNSHGRGLPPSLPRFRPDKYPWMIHSEENAILNCTVLPWMIPGGLTAYITGHPCFRCAYLLRQASIKRVVFSGTKRWLAPPVGEERLFERLLSGGDMTITRAYPDLNWLYDKEHMEELREMGFIT
jgi:dCMP deaminase